MDLPAEISRLLSLFFAPMNWIERLVLGLGVVGTAQAWSSDYIKVGGNDSAPTFSLTNAYVSYQFHVDPSSLDLIHDHFGGPAAEIIPAQSQFSGGWSTHFTDSRREFPDLGRGDYRLPAIHIQHADGDTVSAFVYQHYTIEDGKSPLPGLPATYGESGDVSTLTVHLWDNYSSISVDLHYSIFHDYGAVTRSFNISNWSQNNASIERAASWSIDMPNEEYNMLEFHGDWAHERQRISRPVDYGIQGFRSSAGYSSHYYAPAYAIVSPTTSETYGPAYGFNLVYTGSFSADVERFSHGFVRVLLGLNPLQLSIPLGPSETFTAPEVVAVYSDAGVGGMSRTYHDLFRNHLSRSNHTLETRPPLLNSWEGFFFNFNDTSLEHLAATTAGLGISLFVLDDGWFGTKYPRDNDSEGLGDWTPNPVKFPGGFENFVNNVDSNTVNGTNNKLIFGIWVEPEMVDPKSDLYNAHPEWAMHAGTHTRTLTRHQLVLNLALPDVQDYIITAISGVIDSAAIRYIKWDNNRGINEMPSPATDYEYMLGLYHIMDTLTTKYPQVLFEGCASGGGRFDAGILHYWPQTWTSDNTDAVDRLPIQFGTSVFFPPSSMGCHVSAVPNGSTGRNTTIRFRAHVAMMCGSFGFELNPALLSDSDLAAIPDIIAEAEKINPLVISGSFYRLALPETSNWPAVQFVSQDNSSSVVIAYQIRNAIKPVPPPLRMQGLDPTAQYSVQNSEINGTYSGNTLINTGLNLHFSGDADSQVVWLYKQ